MCGFAVLAVIILLIGLSLSWFVNNKSLSTVGKIQTPAELKIFGPNQSPTTTLEVSYDETRGDVKNADGTVSIRRAFCVKSSPKKGDTGGQRFELQVANTTNIKGLKINVYKVKRNAGKPDVIGLDGFNQPYAWAKDGKAIGFTLINASQDSQVANVLGSPDKTYDNYKTVQENARPIYRYHDFKEDELDYDSAKGRPSDATNFIVECTWDPSGDNAKETDMVYLIARSLNGTDK